MGWAIRYSITSRGEDIFLSSKMSRPAQVPPNLLFSWYRWFILWE